MSNALAAGDHGKRADMAHAVLDPAMEQALGALEKLVQLQLDVGKQEYESSQRLYGMFHLISLGSIVPGVALGAIMGYWLLGAILRQLEQAIAVADGEDDWAAF